MTGWLWKNSRFFRDILYWNWNRKFIGWIVFARKHRLYVNTTPEYLDDMMKSRQSLLTIVKESILRAYNRIKTPMER